MTRARSIVLLSGGLDSSANLALCREHDEPVLALTADYGQRAAAREIAAAHALCQYYGVEHRVLELRWLGALGGSSLTDSARSMPLLSRDQLDDAPTTEKSAKAVWVPNRNGVLINAGAAFAERENCSRVVVGFNREEAKTFPDNSGEFLESASAALSFSTANRVQVHSYSTNWDKTEIVRELDGLSVPFPFDALWSCYLGGEEPCTQCESCQRFHRAVAEARKK